MKENVGVLMPIASLPANHGIGDFGKNSYEFIKWLKKHHYKYWQILPLNPLGPGNSPSHRIGSRGRGTPRRSWHHDAWKASCRQGPKSWTGAQTWAWEGCLSDFPGIL